MPEDRLLRTPKSAVKKNKKKKKRKKVTASNSLLGNADKPAKISIMSLLPNQHGGLGSKPRATSTKDGERLVSSGQRRKKHPKASSASLTATKTPSGHRTVAKGYMSELRGKESLRWEGALEDPQAEEERLELYRANRRQRYIVHREAL